MASERLVVDASYLIEAIAPTSAQWQTDAFDLIDRIASGDVEARVPWLFFAEVAQVVTKRVRGRRTDPSDARDFLQTLDGLGMHVDLSLDGAGQLHAQAMRWNAGAYDAVYVDAASRMAVPIATRDRGMRAACKAAGVALFAA